MTAQAEKNAPANPDAKVQMEVSPHPTSAGKSTDRPRLIIFTALSILACMLALVSVASAAPASGEDQYLEQPPVGGGPGGRDVNNDSYADSVGGSDGTVTEEEVKKKAKKHKKNKKSEGVATAPVGATPSTAAPVTSAATAAKLGPFSRTTGLILIGGIALLLGGLWHFGFIGSGGSGGSGGPGAGGGAGRPPAPPSA